MNAGAKHGVFTITMSLFMERAIRPNDWNLPDDDKLQVVVQLQLGIFSSRSRKDLSHPSSMLVDELWIGRRFLSPSCVKCSCVLKKIMRFCNFFTKVKSKFYILADHVLFVGCVGTWSTKWVYFVLEDLPKFFTCITFKESLLHYKSYKKLALNDLSQ